MVGTAPWNRILRQRALFSLALCCVGVIVYCTEFLVRHILAILARQLLKKKTNHIIVCKSKDEK